ncbi:MAG: hypothetical protein QOJ68_1787 [Blastococcus sp.]|jgi:hypothetical protein|nr:hypothetical protein [Blastococcus sp.]
MTTDPQTLAWLDQEDAHLAQTIRTHRWAVQYVAGGDDSTEPPFGYTVGLFGMGHPELVVVGLGYGLAGEMLNTVGAMVRDGDQLVPGQVLEDDGGTPVITVEELPNPGDVLFAANRFYGRPDEFSVPAFQLIWALDGGIFPWDDGYPHEPDCQPLPGTWRA